MTKTTPPPRANILEALPELTAQTATSIRLHPRRGEVADLAGSKIGGTFLWPEDEAWPTLPSQRPTHWNDDFKLGDRQWDFPDGTPIALVPVLQINAADVPDFPFPPGKNLLQLLWFPLDINEPPYFCEPRVFWRDSHLIQFPLAAMPPSPLANPAYVPKQCKLTFEKVLEYPSFLELSQVQQNRILAWQAGLQGIVFEDTYQDIETLYHYELSVCPSCKLGGHVNWIQDPDWPTCNICNHRMEHLLTLANTEVDSGTWPRWLPLEDRDGWKGALSGDDRVDPADWRLGGGSMYYFVCHFCADWPTKVVYQR